MSNLFVVLSSSKFCQGNKIYAEVKIGDDSAENDSRFLSLSDKPADFKGIKNLIDFLKTTALHSSLCSSSKQESFANIKNRAINCAVLNQHCVEGSDLSNGLKSFVVYFQSLEEKIRRATSCFLAPYQSGAISLEAFQAKNPVSYRLAIRRLLTLIKNPIMTSLEEDISFYFNVGLKGFYKHLKRDPSRNVNDFIEPNSPEFQNFLEAIPLAMEKHFAWEAIDLEKVKIIAEQALLRYNAGCLDKYRSLKNCAQRTQNALLSVANSMGKFRLFIRTDLRAECLEKGWPGSPISDIVLFLCSKEGKWQMEFISNNLITSLTKLTAIRDFVSTLATQANEADNTLPSIDTSSFDKIIKQKQKVIEETSLAFFKEAFTKGEMKERSYLKAIKNALKTEGIPEEEGVNWSLVAKYYVKAAYSMAAELNLPMNSVIGKLQRFLPLHFPGGCDLGGNGYYFNGDNLHDDIEALMERSRSDSV